jgi:hypothetical protein
VVECLPSNCEALSSNPDTTKRTELKINEMKSNGEERRGKRKTRSYFGYVY